MANIGGIVLNAVIIIIGIIVIAIAIINLYSSWQTYQRNNQVAFGNMPALLVFTNLVGIVLGFVLIILGAIGMFLSYRADQKQVITTQQGHQVIATQNPTVAVDACGNPITTNPVTTTNIPVNPVTTSQIVPTTNVPVTTNPVTTAPTIIPNVDMM